MGQEQWGVLVFLPQVIARIGPAFSALHHVALGFGWKIQSTFNG